MELKDNDSLFSINSVFLGPKKWTLPWQVRYVCYVIGTVILLLLLIIEHALGIPFSFNLFLWTFGGTVGITMVIGRHIDYERPARTMVTTVASELLSPRQKKLRPQTVKLRRIK